MFDQILPPYELAANEMRIGKTRNESNQVLAPYELAANEVIDFICISCRKIDFEDLYQNVREGRPSKDYQVQSSSYRIVYTKACIVCRLLFENGQPHYLQNARGIQLRSYSLAPNSRWFSGARELPVPGVTDSVMLFIGTETILQELDPFNYSGYYYGREVFCKRTANDSEVPFMVRPVRNKWHSSTTKVWLQYCLSHHGKSCETGGRNLPGMNLIDCRSNTIVEATNNARWLALSYVWGSDQHNQNDVAKSGRVGFSAGCALPSTTAKTIRDAIVATTELGYRYLWVDEYCINQIDDNHRAAQLRIMDQIYRGADSTIVAAAGEDKWYGLPGVNGTARRNGVHLDINGITLFSHGQSPEIETERSESSNRAWTMQEGYLSRRLLVFSDFQISLYCASSSWREDFGTPELNKQPICLPTYHLFPALKDLEEGGNCPDPKDSWQIFTAMVQLYSKRQLTDETDSLHTFMGIIQHIRRLRPHVYSLSGLPLGEAMERLSKRQDQVDVVIAASLAWSHVIYDERINPVVRRRLLPSWTWAGWQGQVDFMMNRLYEWNCVSLLRDVQFESATGEAIDRLDLIDAKHHERIQSALETITVIHFDAAELPWGEIRYDPKPFEFRYGRQGTRHLLFGRILWIDTTLAQQVLHDLTENVRTGKWSTLMVFRAIHSKPRPHWNDCTFVLVVCWMQDGVTAKRVAGFSVSETMESADGPELDALEDLAEWRRVRLV